MFNMRDIQIWNTNIGSIVHNCLLKGRMPVAFSVFGFKVNGSASKWKRMTERKKNYPPANHHASHLENVLFKGHNHLLTTGDKDRTLQLSPLLVLRW